MSSLRFYFIAFTTLAAIDAFTQVSFKLAARTTGEFVPSLQFVALAAHVPWLYAAVAGYVASFFAWMMVLERTPVGAAFAASHIEIVVILVLSVVLFGEHLDAPKMIGALFIMSGVAVLAVAARRDARALTPASD